VLHEVAAASYVQHLGPAANGEHGQIPLERGGQQRQLGPVALFADVRRLGMRIGVVELRVHVRAAGEDDPVEHAERLLDGVLAGRDHERPASGTLDSAHVRERHDCRRLDPCTPGHFLGVRRNADDRLHAERLEAAQAAVQSRGDSRTGVAMSIAEKVIRARYLFGAAFVGLLPGCGLEGTRRQTSNRAAK
jgi:hypothetical protein